MSLKPHRSGYCTNLGSNWFNFAYTLIGKDGQLMSLLEPTLK